MTSIPASSVPAAVRYTPVAVFLHWFLALAIIAGFVVGLSMSDLPPTPARVRGINYHKWIGVTILWMSLLRLFWRLSHRPPSYPESMPAWQQRAALWGHRALYVFFFIVPLFGWAHSSALGFRTVYLGLIRLPDFVPKDKALAETLLNVHATLAWTLATLVGVHVVAALKHQLIDKDGLLGRMWRIS